MDRINVIKQLESGKLCRRVADILGGGKTQIDTTKITFTLERVDCIVLTKQYVQANNDQQWLTLGCEQLSLTISTLIAIRIQLSKANNFAHGLKQFALQSGKQTILENVFK